MQTIVCGAMTGNQPTDGPPLADQLAARLRRRAPEIERALLAMGAEESAQDADPPAGYTSACAAAVSELLATALLCIESGEVPRGGLPPAADVHLSAATDAGLGLDSVLRLYVRAHNLLRDLIVEEAERGPADHTGLRRALRLQGASLDGLLVALACEHARVARSDGALERRAERIRALLDGGPVEGVELGYELDAWHVGIVAAGARAAPSVGELAQRLDRRVLSVPGGAGVVWGWLGGAGRRAAGELGEAAASSATGAVTLALGEPARGIEGWRLTHRQACAAQLVAARRSQPVTKLADVVLEAAVLARPAITRALEDAYLVPLAAQADGGAEWRATLRAYFAVGRNAATAAARLSVDRHTVQRRLRRIEESLGRALVSCQPELEVALRIEALRELGETPEAR